MFHSELGLEKSCKPFASPATISRRTYAQLLLKRDGIFMFGCSAFLSHPISIENHMNTTGYYMLH